MRERERERERDPPPPPSTLSDGLGLTSTKTTCCRPVRDGRGGGGTGYLRITRPNRFDPQKEEKPPPPE